MAQGAKENECITCNNFINNEFVAPKDGKYKDVICPRDGKVIGKVGVSSKEDVECAIKHAVEAYKKWSDMTVKQRMKPMFKLKELTEKNEETVAKIIMLEHGKNKVKHICFLFNFVCMFLVFFRDLCANTICKLQIA